MRERTFTAMRSRRCPPTLTTVFEEGQTVALDSLVDWDTDTVLPTRPVLAAMKIRAFPMRDKSHKRVKDIADTHAVVWYGGEYGRIQSEFPTHVTDQDLDRFDTQVTPTDYDAAADLIGVDSGTVQQSIEQLLV